MTWVSEQTSLTFDGRDRTNLCLRKVEQNLKSQSHAEFSDCVLPGLATPIHRMKSEAAEQVAAPLKRVIPSVHRILRGPSQSADGRVAPQTWQATNGVTALDYPMNFFTG